MRFLVPSRLAERAPEGGRDSGGDGRASRGQRIGQLPRACARMYRRLFKREMIQRFNVFTLLVFVFFFLRALGDLRRFRIFRMSLILMKESFK